MNIPVPPWMARATELTRAGRLAEAAALIQSALQGAGTPPGPSGGVPTAADVIDVAARVVDETGQPSVDAAPSAHRNEPPQPARQARADVGEFLAGRYTNSAGSRAYKLFVPPAAAARPLPLLVMLHGCTQNPDDFARGTGMNALALAEGLLVLYPEQAHKANTSGCWNWFKHSHQRRGQGEPALLAGMVQECIRSNGADPRRVFVAGLSAGGAMAAILGHTYPELFAAVGVHSGLPVGAAHDLPSALSAMQGGAAPVAPTGPARPTIVFHGDQDTTVHPANGQHLAQASAGPASARTERGRSVGGRAFIRHVYADGAGNVRAEHWVVHGAGHAWAGGGAQGSFTDASGPDASREMLRFFREHPQPAASDAA